MSDEFDRTIFIMETGPGPPPGRPRWYCYEHEPGFDTPDEGVAWALTQTDLVLVRPLNGPYFWAGTEPTEWDERSSGDPLRPWPPSPTERKEIDANYALKVERLAEVKRMAPRLAEAIAQRLGRILPEGWSVETWTEEGQPSVFVTWEGREFGNYGIGDFEIPEIYEQILSDVQDAISEDSTDAWPHDPARGMHLWEPDVEVKDGAIHAWFGPREDPVLELDPIPTAELQ